VDDTWLVLLANNMTDPYYDWPLSDEEFDQYFTDKYSSFSGRTGFDVIRWGQSTTRKDNIVYYYKFIDKSTQQTTPVEPQTDFLTVTNNQLSILLSNGTVTVDGIQYSLEAE
jgi:hypothetical protein